VNGSNVIAAEVHQANASSTDIIFDLELSGDAYPPNQAPVVYAGPGQSIILPATASLSGTVSDDGLPIPPGLLTFSWSKVSGPGAVTFGNGTALNTTAAFSTNGLYGLRLIVSNGALLATNDVMVTGNGNQPTPPRFEPLNLTDSASVFHLRFVATAGLCYSVQYRNSLTSGTWLNLTNIPPQSATQMIEVTDPGTTNRMSRFYRIVLPSQ